MNRVSKPKKKNVEKLFKFLKKYEHKKWKIQEEKQTS